MSRPRFAIYFAPEDGSALARFGREWLGREPHHATPLPLPQLGWTPEFHANIVASPRRYGLHATLKAPIVLADGMDRAELVDALRQFCQRRRPILAAPLTLAQIEGFLALRPSRAEPDIDALAAACVEEFDRFRAQPTATEMAKRLAHPLTPRQTELLARWGYPYVMEQFRFHVTVSERLSDEDEPIVRRALTPRLDSVFAQPLLIDSICLFEQPAHDVWFTLTERVALGG